MFKEIQNKHVFMVHGHLSWWQCFHIPCWREITVSLSHILLFFVCFRFCVISHVSAPKLLSFITVTCTMDTRKAHTVLYNELSHHPYTSSTVSGFSLVQHITQKSKHTSYFKVCHGFSRPSIFNLTHLWYPLIAVQWHNLHVMITCLNLQSHDNISCQTCCYLIF